MTPWPNWTPRIAEIVTRALSRALALTAVAVLAAAAIRGGA